MLDDTTKERIKAHEKLIDAARKKENEDKRKAKKISNKITATVVIETDEPIPPPEPTSEMFYGLIGKIAHIASYGTEINPVSAALSFLSFLGANTGRDTHLLINNTYHHPRLFTLHIGRSSRGGKGDSQQLTHRIRKRIETLEPELLARTHSGGLSSGEGLASLIHDGYGETPAIPDKRLWVVEGELANVLNKIRREGNVLSSTLREMWDGSDIKPAVKTRPMGVTDPHIGLHACITPTELTRTLGVGEIDNGFANRFLMVWAENRGCVAFPEPTPEHVVNQLADLVMDIIRFSLGNYPDSKNGKAMNLSASAKDFYTQIYSQLRRPLDNELISGLLARRPPYLLRLAMLFALTDKTYVIEVDHLKVALAWIEYTTQTVRLVFHSDRQTEKATEIKKNATKILTFLENYQSGNGSSTSEITTQCFKGNLEAKNIKEALHYLLAENPPLIEQIRPKTKQKGRPKISYKIKTSTKKTKKITDHEYQGIEGDFNVRNKCEKIRNKYPENQQKSIDSYSFVPENEEKHPSSPRSSCSFFNSFNSYPNDFDNDPENTENERISAEVSSSII